MRAGKQNGEGEEMRGKAKRKEGRKQATRKWTQIRERA